MINCQHDDLRFSPNLSANRISNAEKVVGINTLRRLLALGLFLLGVNRKKITGIVGIPEGTFFSLLTRFARIGLAAIFDRRSVVLPSAKEDKPIPIAISSGENNVCIVLNQDRQITIPRKNKLQCKTVILSLMNNGLISNSQACEALELSPSRIRTLSTQLNREDVIAILDKRVGQREDYRFTTEAKADLVVQLAAHAITGRSTSSIVLTQELNKHRTKYLSDRSIRAYIEKLGLRKVAQELPNLIEHLKKTP